jgi:hypothetical protein
MNEYFFLTGKNNEETAFAYSETDSSLSQELIPLIKTKTDFPFKMRLKKVYLSNGVLHVSDDLNHLKYLWVDYQPNNLSWPMMSEKMKNVISPYLTGKEGIVWIRVEVFAEKEKREYYIPRFQQKLDVLNEAKTIYVKGTSHVVKPVFSMEKIRNYAMFHKSQKYYWEITSGLYVNNSLKNALKKEKLTGIDFNKTSVS